MPKAYNLYTRTCCMCCQSSVNHMIDGCKATGKFHPSTLASTPPLPTALRHITHKLRQLGLCTPQPQGRYRIYRAVTHRAVQPTQRSLKRGALKYLYPVVISASVLATNNKSLSLHLCMSVFNSVSSAHFNTSTCQNAPH